MDLTNLGQLFHPPLGVDGGGQSLSLKAPRNTKCYHFVLFVDTTVKDSDAHLLCWTRRVSIPCGFAT
jgi:hypothetical protein